MPSSSNRLAAILADEALTAALVPWACPCEFGPEGRYELEELVGVGRESLIYRATDRTLSSEGFDATVAVKIAPSADRLRLDALSARRIGHPHVLALVDQGTTADGVAYAVVEFVDGGDLAARPGPWPARDAAAFMVKLARGVQAAHAAGVVHCDLKPANVLLTREGEPKLGDFDLSFAPSDRSTALRGNLAFMAPEQLAGGAMALTPPADIYALGGLLYWLLTGRCANGDSPETILAELGRRQKPPNPGVERDLNLICMRAMAVRPEDRHHSAGELADDLERWLRREAVPWTNPSVARRTRLWTRRNPARAVLAGALAVLAVAGMAGWQYTVALAHQEELRAQARAVELANGEVAAVHQHMRATMATFYAAGLVHGNELQDQMLPTLVWMEWIADSPVLAETAKETFSVHREMALRSILAQFDADAGGTRIDALLARYSLAYFLVNEGEGSEALEHLQQIRADWAPRLDANDPMLAAIDALEQCALACEAVQRGEPASEVRGMLAAAKAKLTPGVYTPMHRLVSRLSTRFLPKK